MKRGLALLSLMALVSTGLVAEGLDFSFKGVAFNFALLPIPVPTGADVQFGLPLASPGGLPLKAVLRIRGGFEDLRLLRDVFTGDPDYAPTSIADENYYMSPNFQWAAGLLQAIVPGEKENTLEAFLFYRGRFDYFLNNPSEAIFTDSRGIFGTSFLGGVGYNGVSGDSRRVKRGIGAEASAEFGPMALNTGTDFWRLNAKGEFYYPLVSMGKPGNEKLNLFSIYLAGFLSADYAGGTEVPIWVMQSFGGRDLRDSLGSCVRGFPTMSYDSSLKLVANGEIRILGPALFGQAWCIPSAYIFCDTGYFSGFAQSADYSKAKGTITSAGAGFNLDIFDFAYIGLYGGLKFPGSGDSLNLYNIYGETDQFFWKIGFLLHF